MPDWSERWRCQLIESARVVREKQGRDGDDISMLYCQLLCELQPGQRVELQYRADGERRFRTISEKVCS